MAAEGGDTAAPTNETFPQIRGLRPPLGAGLFGYERDDEVEPIADNALAAFAEVATRVKPLKKLPPDEASRSAVRNIAYRYALASRSEKGMTVSGLRPLLEASTEAAQRLKKLVDKHPLVSRVLSKHLVGAWHADPQSWKDAGDRWVQFLSMLEGVGRLDVERVLLSASFDPSNPKGGGDRATGPVGRPSSDHVVIAAAILSRLWSELTGLKVGISRARNDASPIEFKSPGTEFVRTVLMAIDPTLGHESVLEALRKARKVAKASE